MKIIEIVYIKNDLEYIYEFVEYYLNLGVDFIHIIYFRSEQDKQDIYQLLNKFNEKIKIEEQTIYNEHCIIEYYSNYYKDKYDWLMFFNCDEFLTFNKHKNIREYLSDHIFDNYEQIQINWKIYDDNDLLYNDNRKMIERFTRPTNNSGNISVKPIIRGKLNIKYHNVTPHFFANLKTCDSSGNNLYRENLPDSQWGYTFQIYPPNYDLAYIKHFMTKTIDEFIRNKMPINTDEYKRNIDFFWSINKKTPEKINYMQKYKNLI